MTPGLPPPPQPPHDPKSVLLNGRLGFRAMAPASGVLAAEVNRECCALVLPRLSSTLRDLAEPSGSLGGVRLPSNAALGPDGSIYLLDRTRLELKRFDPCECRFVRVPCLGGEGGGARQLRNPGGIAIACGNVYICDTGVGQAPPAEECGDQAVLDARISAESRRVSVFTLKGFALRGHLVPPRHERPWQPVSVALDSLGRAWVADAVGRLHRFTPNGSWERAWPMVPVARHLAIDCKDRVYVIAHDSVPAVRVLDAHGQPVTDPPKLPADVSAAFPRLPFEVDVQGRLWLEPCCDVCAVCDTDATDLVFDAEGNAVKLSSSSLAQIFEKSAVYRSEPLDSLIAQCVWHRISLFGSLPTGTRIVVRTFCADERLTGAELDALASWRECAVAAELDRGDSWDCLVRAEPGRYLWMELQLEGNGLATPAIGAIVAEFPRISLRRFLPAVFGMEPVSADFTDRFLALFDTPLRSIERKIDRMAELFDPLSAPDTTSDPRQLDFLTWLGSWVGISLGRHWDVPTRRRFLKRAGALFDKRGTPAGLHEELLLVLGFDQHALCAVEERARGRCNPYPRNCGPEPESVRHEPPPLVLEHFRLRRWLRVGAARLGSEAVIWGERIVGRTRIGAHGQLGVTRLDTSPDPTHDPFLVHANQFSVFVPARFQKSDRDRKALENLLKSEAPASTQGYLHFVEPRFRIGIQSMLGLDAVVASVPQGVTLGETRLGDAPVLTTSSHLQGNPAIAIGREGRVGTTALLA